MKRKFALCFVLLIIACSGVLSASAGGVEEDVFLSKLENKLKQENPYYHNDTLSFNDAITFKGEVTKITKPDNPDTKENEQEIEKYQSNIVIGLAHFQDIRGHLFTFDNQEIYYFDADNEEILTSQNVIQNKQAEEFYEAYKETVGKEKSTHTNILITFMLLFLVFFPWLIAMIQSKRMGAEPRFYHY